MNTFTKGVLGILSLGVLATGASYASAATNTTTTTPTNIERGVGCHGGEFNNENRAKERTAQQEKLATFLGVSVSDLESARTSRTSIEDFAISKGKTKEQLQAFFTEQQAAHKAELQAKLDADVASGKITAAQRDAMLQRIAEPRGERGMHRGMFQGR